MPDNWIIRNARLLDPADGTERRDDLFITDGHISAAPPPRTSARILDAGGWVVCPGFIDLHVHFREPGQETAETVQSGSESAVAGGFTTVVTMPNTRPPVDTPEHVRHQFKLAADAGRVRLLPSACLTIGRAGNHPADIAGMAAAGAIAFTDDGSTVTDTTVMRTAMLQAHATGRPVFDHALDPALAGNGVIREGDTARRLNLPGIPPEAETAIVRRDIALASETGCHLHLQHLFAGDSIHLLRDAVARGIPVSAEATPHHLALCDADIPDDDACYKMNPPLASAGDRDRLLDAVADGSITVLATDHAPHTALSKAGGFRTAPFGVIGLETAVGVTFTLLVVPGRMPLIEWIRRWTTGPARILHLPPPSLRPGTPADLVCLDLHSPWTVDPARFRSLSRNTPFAGRTVTGRAMITLIGGNLRYAHHSGSK